MSNHLTPRLDFLLMAGAGLLSGCAASSMPAPFSSRQDLKVVQTANAVMLVDARTNLTLATYTEPSSSSGGILSVNNGLSYLLPKNMSWDGSTDLGNGLTITVKGSTTTWIAPNGNVGSVAYDGVAFTITRPTGTQVVPHAGGIQPLDACGDASKAALSAMGAMCVAGLAVALAPEAVITEIAFIVAAKAFDDANKAIGSACPPVKGPGNPK